MFIFNQYTSAEQLTKELTKQIITDLSHSISHKECASIAVSGGKTPIPLFEMLSQQDINWSKVVITLVDDRWVDESNDSSNEKLVKAHLLQNRAKHAKFIGLKNSANSPFEGAKSANEKLQQIPLPFDVVILGMGEDGHTASLFPHAANLSNGLDMDSGHLVVGMTPLTAPLDRITLTLPAILNSHNIYLHIVGESKKQVLEQAKQDTDITSMPIRAILQQNKVDVTAFWCK